MEDTYQDGIWKMERIGRNIYKIYVRDSPNAITMTAADITTLLRIPFMHRLLSINLHHVSSTYADSTNALTATFQRAVTTQIPAKYKEILWQGDYIVDPTVSEVFGEGFEREESTYSLVLNSTATDLILPVIYIQHLGDED